MAEELLDHIRSLCRLMRQSGLTELDTTWGETRIRLRSEREVSRHAAPAAFAARPEPPAERGGELIEIRSPLLGMFYRAPAPDRPPFVEVGDLIEEGQTVAVVEAMKVINDITAEVGGRVVEICVGNGVLINEGDVLMRLEQG
jgi:acetyl-CoA carboxylase biotin carboxyl carrier protein